MFFTATTDTHWLEFIPCVDLYNRMMDLKKYIYKNKNKFPHVLNDTEGEWMNGPSILPKLFLLKAIFFLLLFLPATASIKPSKTKSLRLAVSSGRIM